MNRLLEITMIVMMTAIVVLYIMYVVQKERACEWEDNYRESVKTNEALQGVIAKLNREAKIRSEQRRKADEKILDAYNGTAVERFNAINNGLSNNKNN